MINHILAGLPSCRPARGERSLSMAEGTPSREVLFFFIPSYSLIFENLDIFFLQMCLAYEYIRVTSLLELLSAAALGERRCGANGKGIIMCKGIIINSITLRPIIKYKDVMLKYKSR